MNETLKELIEEHEANIELLPRISNYSIRILYKSLVKELIEIAKGENV